MNGRAGRDGLLLLGGMLAVIVVALALIEALYSQSTHAP